MTVRFRQHFRSQFVGYIALVISIGGGTAYAAATIGSAEIIDESIRSQDIQNGQVGTGDLAANAVRTSKVLDESLTGHDIQDNTIGGADVNESLLDPMTSAQIQNESLTGHDIQDDTIGGADVNESLLDPMTSAQIANESLTGHDIRDNTIGGADVNESRLDGVAYSPGFATHDPPDFLLPADGSYAQVIYTGDGSHGDPLIHVPVPGLVMASASLNLIKKNLPFHAYVTCELGLVPPGGARIPIGQAVRETMSEQDEDETNETVSMTGGRNVPSGDYYVNVVCKSENWLGGVDGELDRVTFASGSLIAWAT